jgi:hypothetical protein
MERLRRKKRQTEKGTREGGTETVDRQEEVGYRHKSEGMK